ncbi:dipeptidyl aminopeptidase/acylaminoacyl peptidase [Evansella vedderi]|uniref:Dipeptidyl aminopeptidase/acylaminoacyl peptidase n=1 Tax=Evansella vedderi TaxID=38282 RepID=A0ABT9ZYB6_9BACI|nr:S9 family peptidase [Evansella vedderi]MDQ0255686.1 dipeptidyl aminopeptidase/acylaminoacyl peptidase [Evansella vedderi]
MRNFQTEDLYSFKGVGEVQISPDGSNIVYVVQHVDKKEDKFLTNIYMKDLNSHDTKQLTFSGKDKGPIFSPDGKKIAFVSTRTEKNQIYILPLDGGEPWCLKTKEAVAPPLIWSPNGDKIIYSAQVFSHEDSQWTPYPGAPEKDTKRLKEIADNLHKSKDEIDKDKDKKKNEVKVITRFSYRFDGQGYFGNVRSQIFITDVPSQPDSNWKEQGRQITGGDFDHSGPTLSPCGNYLVVSSRRTTTADYDKSVDLWLFEVKSGNAHLLYEAPGPTQSPNWSTCGRFVVFGGHDNKAGESTTTHLWVINVEKYINELKQNGNLSPLTVKNALNLMAELDRPLGGSGSDVGIRGGNAKVWQKDRLLFLVNDRGAGQIYEASTKDFQVKPYLTNEHRSIASIQAGDEIIIYSATSPVQPPELFLHNGEKGEIQLTNVNADLMNNIQIGPWEKFTYKSEGNQKIDGWIVYPSEFDQNKKYPLVLLIHGGPHASYGPGFMFTAQIFSTQGYVVLFTNPRGSEAYGQNFACSIDKNWGDLDYKDIMAGVDTVISKGFIDTNNMFVHGWSYGGYMSCWISTQTDRFKAICAGASVTNMLSGYGTSDITMADEYEYGGTPWKDGEHLIRHSAIGHVEKVTTPVMLMHGENDLRVAPSQTEEFYIALKRLGKEAIMIRYPDEFHGLSRPIHQIDRFERLVAWFNYYRN